MKRRSAQKRLGALLTAEAATQAAASNEYIHIFIHALYGISAQGPTITLHGLLAWADPDVGSLWMVRVWEFSSNLTRAMHHLSQAHIFRRTIWISPGLLAKLTQQERIRGH